MIEMKKQVTPGETPAQITVSMIDQDLKDGISKSEMAIKYGIKPWEVDEMFKHPFLKGRRPSRKKALSFKFVDDTLPLNSGDIAVEQAFHADEEVDPNQITLEDAIDDAIESTEAAKVALDEAVEVIDETFPTEFEEEKPMQTNGIDNDALEPDYNTKENYDNEEDDDYISDVKEEEELEMDDDSFEL